MATRFGAWRLVRRRCLPTSSTCTRRFLSQRPTNIEKIVLDNIKATGPLSISTYMQLCLSHPTEGYYMRESNPVFGTGGDFITSPEISQIFGELVAVWLLFQWQGSGSNAFRLVELGPGRGTLMEDILRVISRFPTSLTALSRVHLIENSPSMRTIQRDRLLPLSEKATYDITWHSSIDDIMPDPGCYTMVVAHEFFDALPIHVVERTHHGWQEIMIARSDEPFPPSSISTPDSESVSARLCRVRSRSPTAASTLLGLSSPRFMKLPLGAHVEVSLSAFKIARRIGDLLAVDGATEASRGGGGCALIVDYGDERAFGNSLRAFKNHKIVDVFDCPGECDLTANVDFAYLKEAMSGLVQTHGPITQATFLDRMGLRFRVASLTRVAPSPDRRRAIEDAVQRLVDPLGMGREYRVLGVTSTSARRKTHASVWPFVDRDFD